MAINTISLTDQIDVTNGAHILYFYNSEEGYIANAVAFAYAGLMQGQHVVLIERESHRREILERLAERVPSEAFERVRAFDSKAFYCEHGTLHVKDVLRSFDGVFAPLMEAGATVRSWGHVHWESQADIYEQLEQYERRCDTAVNEIGILGVCVYDGRRVPASIQNEMLRTHEYFMTDTTLTKSMFYEKKERKVVFPSLSVHAALQSEVDWYKQKLDFAHVISHEVRNPLTVIRAYAALLLGKKALDEDGKSKLRSIVDYVDVIDHEMAHIINTEQMLSTDALWAKSVVAARPVVDETMEMMSTKARTQGIECVGRIALNDETVFANAVGMKLILSNLVSNAIKYSREAGRVEVRAEASEGRLTFVVRDEGIGMTAEQTGKLFRKYEKMNDEKSGQGIGLFMVKKLTDYFEGEIDVRSEPNRGTTVTVSLPLCDAAASA
ncbi:MEDS domain-containing protein [Paenibacillus sp.]|uniref:MEDS domain-containing protein n=1 Tax=Paenibacillus sp. TaxID=58172 RepID=UPI002D3E6301|nr:MEDS domain-containing protein [Paenibacillus sp.]HZG56224.1 MEDS domain-containing protein [Paenibacillus sp.]